MKYTTLSTVEAEVKKGEAYKIKRADYKKKVEKDGDIKIKDGIMKIKIDGKTGEKNKLRLTATFIKNIVQRVLKKFGSNFFKTLCNE